MALEVLQWLLADPDLKEHLGRATLASTQHPDQMCKMGMLHEFDRKLSFSGCRCASGLASCNGVTLQRDFLGRTCAWNQAFLLKNERVISEMVGKAIAQVGLIMIIASPSGHPPTLSDPRSEGHFSRTIVDSSRLEGQLGAQI